MAKEVRARLHLSDEMQVYLSERAEKSHRSVNDEIVSIVEESKMSEHHRPCIISIGVAPGADRSATLKELHELFSYVDGAPFKGEFQVLCAGPLHGLSYDEAFILCQKKFFEVGWVYADAVQK